MISRRSLLSLIFSPIAAPFSDWGFKVGDRVYLMGSDPANPIIHTIDRLAIVNGRRSAYLRLRGTQTFNVHFDLEYLEHVVGGG
jgi:hypothetical protein